MDFDFWFSTLGGKKEETKEEQSIFKRRERTCFRFLIFEFRAQSEICRGAAALALQGCCDIDVGVGDVVSGNVVGDMQTRMEEDVGLEDAQNREEEAGYVRLCGLGQNKNHILFLKFRLCCVSEKLRGVFNFKQGRIQGDPGVARDTPQKIFGSVIFVYVSLKKKNSV